MARSGLTSMKEDPRSSYSFEPKLAAVQAHLEGRLTSVEAMHAHSAHSKSSYFRWCAAFGEGGAEELCPKKRGRPESRRRLPSTASV